MKVNEIMTHDPVYCTPESLLTEVAGMMKECDCGAIPVVEDEASRTPLGIITDRDIVIRALAEGKDPSRTAVESCMTRSLVTVRPEDSVEECVRLMEEHQIRRILVIDGQGALTGMVVQAHIARNASKEDTGEMVQDVLKPDRR
jgi:CBS domain-containing protein